MIEHISYADGLKMLAECFRVLKPNGRIRIATPDLRKIINLYADEPINHRYIDFVAKSIQPSVPHCAATVINNFVRAWGHTFIYDEDILANSMKTVGFVAVEPQRIGISSDPHFTGLENQQRMVTLPDEFYELETIVFEGVKAR
jgi:predicted SAM-dependent methyltransferase